MHDALSSAKKRWHQIVDFDRLVLILAVALPVGTVIQFSLPVGRTGLAVTLSDAVVAVTVPLLAVEAIWHRRPQIESLVPRLLLWLSLMSAVLIIGLLIAYLRVGIQPWAATRLLGWFALLGHLVVAARIASDPQAQRLALRVFIVCAAASVCLDIGKTIESSVLVSEETCRWAMPAFGLMQNPNAFAFILLTACAVIIGESQRDLFGKSIGVNMIVVILVIGIGLTASRSAWVSLAAVIGIASMFRETRQPRLGLGIAIGVAAVVLLSALLVCKTSAVGDHAKVVASALSDAKLDGSNIERLYTWRRALELFAAHPLFGAGFGAFLEAELARGSTPLIIHSTPLWLLAEGGLVGASAYVMFGIAIAVALISRIRSGPDVIRQDAITALLVAAGFAVMSLLQELLYQRCLWVVLSLLIFHPVCSSRSQAS